MTTQKRQKLAVLLGGISEEREVSLRSGQNVSAALDRLGYQVQRIDPAVDNIIEADVDLVFNALHGRGGEDGSIQGLMDLHNIRYTGSGPEACIIAMNKLMTKRLLQVNHLPTPPFSVLVTGVEQQVSNLNYPLVVKPLDQGSSVGVEIADTPQEFQDSAKRCLTQFYSCLVEEYIEGKEITVGVIDKNGLPMALPILELQPSNRFYDYEAKYTPGMTKFILPANLDKSTTDRCQQVALQVYKLIGCRGMARIDMIVSPKKGPFVLELNTVPGMTELSDLPAQAKQAGMSFDELVECVLKSVR